MLLHTQTRARARARAPLGHGVHVSPHTAHPALPLARASSAAATEAASSFSSSSSYHCHCCCCDRLSPLILLPPPIPAPPHPPFPAPPAQQPKAEPSAAASLLLPRRGWNRSVLGALCCGLLKHRWLPDSLGGAPGRGKGDYFPVFCVAV